MHLPASSRRWQRPADRKILLRVLMNLVSNIISIKISSFIVLIVGTDENEHTPGKPSIQDLQSKGPAIPQSMDDMPPKASKEELKARAKELNQE